MNIRNKSKLYSSKFLQRIQRQIKNQEQSDASLVGDSRSCSLKRVREEHDTTLPTTKHTDRYTFALSAEFYKRLQYFKTKS